MNSEIDMWNGTSLSTRRTPPLLLICSSGWVAHTLSGMAEAQELLVCRREDRIRSTWGSWTLPRSIYCILSSEAH